MVESQGCADRPKLVVLLPGQPQLLKGAADAKNRASDPRGMVALHRQSGDQLHLTSDQCSGQAKSTVIKVENKLCTRREETHLHVRWHNAAELVDKALGQALDERAAAHDLDVAQQLLAHVWVSVGYAGIDKVG